MNNVLLDSSALLALIHREKGYDGVIPFMDNAVMSAVNYSETISKLTEQGVPHKEAVPIVDELLQEIVSFDAKAASIAGRLRMETKALGLSLGDRACLATAEALGLDVVTADKIWAKVKTPVKIKIIR